MWLVEEVRKDTLTLFGSTQCPRKALNSTVTQAHGHYYLNDDFLHLFDGGLGDSARHKKGLPGLAAVFVSSGRGGDTDVTDQEGSGLGYESGSSSAAGSLSVHLFPGHEFQPWH